MQQPPAADLAAPGLPLPPAWFSSLDTRGNTFYFNLVGESRWTHPALKHVCSGAPTAQTAATPAAIVKDVESVTVPIAKDMSAFDEDDEAVINPVPSRPPRKRARAPAPAVEAPWNDTAIMQAYDAAVKRGPLNPTLLEKKRREISSASSPSSIASSAPSEEEKEHTERIVEDYEEEDRKPAPKSAASKPAKKKQQRAQPLQSASQEDSSLSEGLMMLPEEVRKIAENFYNAGYLSGYAVGLYVGTYHLDKARETADDDEESTDA